MTVALTDDVTEMLGDVLGAAPTESVAVGDCVELVVGALVAEPLRVGVELLVGMAVGLALCVEVLVPLEVEVCDDVEVPLCVDVHVPLIVEVSDDEGAGPQLGTVTMVVISVTAPL